MAGQQIKLFLIDGTPGGLTTAEITNWTGHVLHARRSDLGALLHRAEAQRTGVYLLLADDPTAIGETRCYIGEADVVADRLRHHHRDKEFWDRAVVVTSKDTNLTKSHGRYLEARLIALATKAARVSLENSTKPPLPALPEADASDMDFFLAQLQIVLPVLGVNAVRSALAPAVNAAPAPVRSSPLFRLVVARTNVDAQARQIDGEFTVLAGSRVVASWSDRGSAESTRRAYESYRERHAHLVRDGSIRVQDGVGVLTRDVVFSSSSLAGAVMIGRSCNGRISWVSDDGNFGQWEARNIAPVPQGEPASKRPC